jgi:hypothetical protein
MTSFSPDKLPFIAPELYTPHDLSPLVGHSDLAGSTIETHNVSRVLPSFVAMGRTALTRDDIVAYQGWVDHTVQFTRDGQSRGTVELREAQHSLTALNFFGAMHGSKDAADELHQSLAAPIDFYTMEALMTLCAQHAVSPTAWINAYAETPDNRAMAWNRFLYAKRVHLMRSGRPASPDTLYEPGVEQFVHEITDGELSASATLGTTLEAYLLSTDPFVKRLLTSRYGLSIGEYLSASDEIEEFHNEDLSMMRFAAAVNSDPDIPLEVKADLSEKVAPELPPWSDTYGVEARGLFELSVAISNGKNVTDLLSQIEAMTRLFSPHSPYGGRDHFLSHASELYWRSGQYDSAAATIAHISNTSEWCFAVERYAQAGGNLDLIHQADEMRQIFGDEHSSAAALHNPLMWFAREQIASFLLHMSSPVPDFAQAREMLLRMAASMPQDRLGVNYVFFRAHLERLLAADQDAVSLGPDIIKRMAGALLVNRHAIYEVFAAHGSAEMTKSGWEQVQDSRYTPSIYFDRYAHMALASAGVTPPERK